MAVFLAGGTGKTANSIAHLLQDANVPFVVGSRRGEAAAPVGMVGTNGQRISAIYILLAYTPDPGAAQAFIDYAFKTHQVKRFVLLAGSTTKLGDSYYGRIWQHLLDLGVEYCILRPTWFIENFSNGWHFTTIQKEGKICSACGDGKATFISATDIAAVAFRALTDEKAHNSDYALEGAELLTHDEVAVKFSRVLGRQILHVKETREQIKQRYLSYGLQQSRAELHAWFEDITAKGALENTSDTVERVTGRAPLTFDAFLERNRAVWDL